MYKHTQVGWYIILLVLPVCIGLAFLGMTDMAAAAIAIAALLLVVVGIFGFLTVTADEKSVGFHFGPGIISKRYTYDQIESVVQVRNSWIFGWGIRWYGPGWLYNVSGLDAIELKLKSGKKLRIGTDEPERLMSFIRMKMAG